MQSPSRSEIRRHALVLGLLTAIGPFAIDMYLPALPSMALDLGATPEAVQASLTAFFLALGAGQLFCGPLSDMFGRRRPMFVGLAVFGIGSVGCALAPDTGTLVALRFVQGLGACACMVTPRAVVRDLYSGPAAARLMSLLLTVYSVSPILAPLGGSLVAARGGWRAVFWAIAGVAAVSAAVVARLLPETREPAAREQGGLRAALAGYRILLGDRHFVALALIASLTLSGFFIYVANSSFVLSSHFGVGPRAYALLFALNAVALVAVSQANGWLAARFGLPRSIRMAAMAQATTLCLLVALLWAGIDPLWLIVSLLMVAYGLNGVIVPSTFVLAMQAHGSLAGTASALIGTLNFAGGAIVVAALAPFANGTPLPMVAATAGCSLLVLLLAAVTPRRR